MSFSEDGCTERQADCTIAAEVDPSGNDRAAAGHQRTQQPMGLAFAQG